MTGLVILQLNPSPSLIDLKKQKFRMIANTFRELGKDPGRCFYFPALLDYFQGGVSFW